MKIEVLPIDGVVLIEPRVFADDRGWFSESWNAAAMRELGLDIDWVQDNHSQSVAKGTLRGLHYQTPPHAQDKLVRCTRGSILDVAVDVRKGSPTYLQNVAVELSAQNHKQLFVPKGFLHGFLTLGDDCEVQYKCSDFYSPAEDRSIAWDDPDIGIDWPLSTHPILSDKDASAPRLADSPSPFLWEADQ